MRPFTETPPRRRARRPGIIRSLLGLLRPFDSERFTLREAMSPADWKRLACERGAKLAQQEREAADMAIEIRTLRRAVSLADEGKRIAEAGMRHADGERDAALDCQPADGSRSGDYCGECCACLRRAVRVREEETRQKEDARQSAEARAAEALALLDSERAAWREERAGHVRQRTELIALWQQHNGDHRDRSLIGLCLCRWCALGRALGLLPAADPDPRQGTPGGADLLEEVTPGTPEFKRGALLYRQPDGTVGPVPPPAPAAPEVQPVAQVKLETMAPVQVRTVVLDRTPPFVPPPAPEVRPPHDRVPDMSRRPVPAPSDDPVDVAERLVESRLRGEGAAS